MDALRPGDFLYESQLIACRIIQPMGFFKPRTFGVRRESNRYVVQSCHGGNYVVCPQCQGLNIEEILNLIMSKENNLK